MLLIDGSVRPANQTWSPPFGVLAWQGVLESLQTLILFANQG
jgi:hypothetical protein